MPSWSAHASDSEDADIHRVFLGEIDGYVIEQHWEPPPTNMYMLVLSAREVLNEPLVVGSRSPLPSSPTAPPDTTVAGTVPTTSKGLTAAVNAMQVPNTSQFPSVPATTSRKCLRRTRGLAARPPNKANNYVPYRLRHRIDEAVSDNNDSSGSQGSPENMPSWSAHASDSEDADIHRVFLGEIDGYVIVQYWEPPPSNMLVLSAREVLNEPLVVGSRSPLPSSPTAPPPPRHHCRRHSSDHVKGPDSSCERDASPKHFAVSISSCHDLTQVFAPNARPSCQTTQ
ncbi:hypothetical protein MRX96_058267 [Rhipicephalus microplus]